MTVNIGTFLGIALAEVSYQIITIGTSYKIIRYIPRGIKVAANLTRNIVKVSSQLSRKQVDKGKIFDDLCDHVDLINY